ncbi:45171_t:CDS:1, partial [Gigaspora margarita]
MSHDETSTAELSETFHERKNHLAKEAYACHTANKTIKDAEQHRSVQRQRYARQHKEESAEQTEIQRKKQKNAKYKITKAAHYENYNTNDATLHNI